MGFIFFLKASAKKENVRAVYLRVIVDGILKEVSIKQRWDATRWNQKIERAIGTREDAWTLNLFLDFLQVKINQFRIDQLNYEKLPHRS